MNKYLNNKYNYNGYIFDSKKEMIRYQELLLLQKLGILKNLIVHPKFVLLEGFVDIDGNRQRPINYIADFQYVESEKIIVEDVKAKDMKTGKLKLTIEYKIKKKLFLNRYKMIHFREYF